MRSAIFLLVSSCCLALLPGFCRAAIDKPERIPLDVQNLLESEFAFQSGKFTQALAFYKNRPLDGLESPELVRAGQMAVAAGDTIWLQTMLASPGASELKDLSALRLAEALRTDNDQAAWRAWRDLLAQPQGIESGRGVIESYSRRYRPALERTLGLYAEFPALSDAERFELFLYAIQWQQDAVADQLLSGIGKTGGKAQIAELVNTCLRFSKSQCTARIEVLQPLDFDELQRRTVLSVARRHGLEQQVNRWMMALPQDSSSYYQRILQLGRQFDEAQSRMLSADIERDPGLTHFQRAALLGSIAELRKDWPAAETHYREALVQDSPTTACIRLAVVLFRQNRKSEAMQVLAETQRDATLSDEIRREAFFTEIQFLQMGALAPGASANALNDIYRRALTAWPMAHRIRYQYAMRLFGQGKVEQALDELETVLRSAPADVDALNAYGYTLAKEMNRPGSAFKPLQNAFLIAPNRAEVLDSYGYVLHRLGRNSQALPPLQKAWETTPSAVTAGHLVKVYWQLGDKRQAQDFLNKGLELDAQEAELIKLKELLP